MLPDGSGVLAAPGEGVRFVDVAADTSWLLIPEGRHPVYVETGHILYVPPGGGLFAQAFDLASHTVSGSRRQAVGVATSSMACPSHNPFASRKVGTPDSAEMPAPVSTITRPGRCTDEPALEHL